MKMKTKSIKFVIASHVPFPDQYAVSFVHCMLEEYAKQQKAMKRDLNPDTPYLVKVEVIIKPIAEAH